MPRENAMMVRLNAHHLSAKEYNNLVQLEQRVVDANRHPVRNDLPNLTMMRVLSHSSNVKTTIKSVDLFHEDMTAWLDPKEWDGYKIMPISQYDRYCKEMNERIEGLVIWRNCLREYLQDVRAAAAILLPKDSFDPDAHLTPDDITDRIGISYEFQPVPAELKELAEGAVRGIERRMEHNKHLATNFVRSIQGGGRGGRNG